MKQVKPGNILVINENECRALISDEKVLALTEQALADFSNGTAINPIKLHLPLFPENNGWINSMPSWLKRQNVVGMKWVNVHGDNAREHGLPTVVGTCLLNDPATGIPYALVDGTIVTALRTGAVAALMAKYCCKKDSKVLTIVGAGVQGNTALVMTLLSVPGIREVRAVDIRPEACEKLIENGKKRFADRQIDYKAMTDLQAACTGADIIISAAHGVRGGLLDKIALDPGCTVVSIAEGLDNTTRKKYDRVIMDFIACVVHRSNQSGKYMQELYGEAFDPIDLGIADGEIGDVITGKIPGRENDEQVVFASGVGMSVEDIAVAYEIYERALEQGVGAEVELFNTL